MITITDRAKKAFKEITEKKGLKDQFLQIVTTGFG